MTNADPEVLLHPVRIKILTALAEREATPQEIAAVAGDVPKASLYRHINILRAVGAIREVREYRVRGTFEKVYALVTDSGPLAGLGADGQIAERLRRMIRPEETTADPAGVVRRWTAALSAAETEEFQAMIDDWLQERGGEGGAPVEITMALEINVAVDLSVAVASEPMDLAVVVASEPMDVAVTIVSGAEQEDAA